MVAAVPRTPLSFNVLTTRSLKSMNCGACILTTSARSVSNSASRGHCWNRQRVCDQLPCWKWTQNPDHWGKIHQQQRTIFWCYQPQRGKWFAFIFETFRLPLRPQDGDLPITPIITGDRACSTLTMLPMLSGVLPLM